MYIYIKAKLEAVQPNTCEAPSGVLCPVLRSPVQVGCRAVGPGPEEGHKGGQRARTPLL